MFDVGSHFESAWINQTHWLSSEKIKKEKFKIIHFFADIEFKDDECF